MVTFHSPTMEDAAETFALACASSDRSFSPAIVGAVQAAGAGADALIARAAIVASERTGRVENWHASARAARPVERAATAAVMIIVFVVEFFLNIECLLIWFFASGFLCLARGLDGDLAVPLGPH